MSAVRIRWHKWRTKRLFAQARRSMRGATIHMERTFAEQFPGWKVEIPEAHVRTFRGVYNAENEAE